MVAGRLLSGCEGPDAAVARACPEGSRQKPLRCSMWTKLSGCSEIRLRSRSYRFAASAKEVLIEVSRQAPQQQEQPEKQQPWQEAGQAPQRASQPAAAMENRKKGSVLENRKDGQIRLTIVGRPSLCFDRTSGTWTDPETSGAGSGISTIEQASKHGQGQKTELQQPDTNAPVRTAEERTCPAADTPAAELAAAPGYLLIPDVTLYKARLVQAYASRCGCTARPRAVTVLATGYRPISSAAPIRYAKCFPTSRKY